MPFDLENMETAELMRDARASLGVDRDHTGKFVRGNTAALVTGSRSVQFLAAAEEQRQAVRNAIAADKGFSRFEDAPVALRLAADGAAQAAIVRDAAFARMVENGGPLTGTDRERGAHKIWAANADRLLRHAQGIGFERVAGKTISPLDYIAGKVDA